MNVDKIDKLLDNTVERKVKLEIIQEMTESRIKGITGLKEVPVGLEYVVANITMARFNKIGSEGMKSTDQEGLSFVFSENDFKDYMDDILAYKDDKESDYGKSRKGKVWFI